ncbi:unnamed protein product [Parnassius mnemosyne]|uniref:RNA-directed DNA polymerase n=1 Tax=Parnassius mnemosyne TaxID=213953 RepID=A0AAV1KNU3_9NEOP
MEGVLSPPKPFRFDGSSDYANLSASWTKWRNSYEIYTKACEITNKAASVQINILLHVLGEQCREILDQNKDSLLKCTTAEAVLQILDGHFNIKPNVTVERHRFFTRNQRENETIEQYVFDLQKLAQTCDFGALNDGLIKDRLICGVSNSVIRERLLREYDLTLSKALEICRVAIVSRVYADNIKQEQLSACLINNNNQAVENDENIWSVRHRRDSRRGYRGGAGGVSADARIGGRGVRGGATRSAQRPPLRARGERAFTGSTLWVKQCGHCGSVHKKFECPAYGKQCLRCAKMNHFARACVARVFNVEESDEQVIHTVKSSSEWNVNLMINNKSINFKLDTGADVNILPLYYLPQIGVSDKDLLKTNTKLSGYSGTAIKVVGKITLKVYYKSKMYMLEFKIADVKSMPVLGRFACSELDMVRRVMSIQEDSGVPSFLGQYDDVFQGIGCLPGNYRIKLHENVVPVVHAPRKLPFAIRDNVKKKLEEMEKQGIIAKVEGPSDWVSSLTIVKKANGDIRVCLDPKELNSAIKREYFRLPSLDEIVSKLSGARYFSTLDAVAGFWQVALDDTSELCTFNTPFGRYKFLRLPYGICSAPEVFHKKIYENFDDLDGVCMYIDDLLVYGCSKKEHDERLKLVLDRCRKVNLKLNKNKCKFGLEEIRYLGHRITKKGLYPDNSHITAITNMPKPENKKDVERLLGLITYVGAFIPNLSDKTLLLRVLLKKETEWHWDERHDECLKVIKECLSKPPVLRYYDLDLPITISVDASKSGLGACLMQNGMPVCYASKSLSKAEQRYAQIEKELYACVFACERFHAYIYGRTDVVIETDHKPLVSIIKKPIVDSPSRLQRMLLKLQRYTFKLVYKAGKHLFIADALSRAYEPEPALSAQLSSAVYTQHDEVCAITRDMAMSAATEVTDLQFIKLQKSSENDDELALLRKYIIGGWPANKHDVMDLVKPYWGYKEHLSIAYGLVWKDQRIVVPKLLRKDLLNKIHVGHVGLQKCQLRARETVFWPGINNDLKNLISNCSICLTYRKHNQKEEMQPHEIPDRPWAKVGTDLFQIKGVDYLLLVDYYSKFFEIEKLQCTTSPSIIETLKNIFCRQGIPNVVMSDCGPQFSSSLFRQFSLEWNFKHITSSPRYPQSNGQIERMVQTVKNIILKSKEDGVDYRLALLEYLNTPLENNISSPAELLQSRKFRSMLPKLDHTLKPKLQKNVHNKLVMRQNNQKYYYDQHTRNLDQLSNGQKVRVLLDVNKREWLSGTILCQLRYRSYKIKLANGSIIIRNRRHIIKDSPHRKVASRYTLNNYDDIQPHCPQNNQVSNCTIPSGTSPNTVNNNNYYVTRSGRTVRPPDRLGFEH